MLKETDNISCVCVCVFIEITEKEICRLGCRHYCICCSHMIIAVYIQVLLRAKTDGREVLTCTRHPPFLVVGKLYSRPTINNYI